MRWSVLLCAGCAVEERVQLQVPIVAGRAGEIAFAASDGGTVTLTAASVTFRDLRLEEPPAPVASWSLSPFASAWAHPGHDYPGDVAGELLGEFTVDLLAPDAALGVAPCYSGEYATGRVTLASAHLAGTHTDAAGVSAPFAFDVAAEQDIVGVPFDVTLPAGAPPEAIAVRFDPAHALSFAEWGAAADALDNTVVFGVVATPSWSIELHP